MVPTPLLCCWERRNDGLEKRWRPGGSAWLGRAQVWTEETPLCPFYNSQIPPETPRRVPACIQPAPVRHRSLAQKDQQLWITLLLATTPLSRIRRLQETLGANEWLTSTDSTKATTDSDPLIFMYIHIIHSQREFSKELYLNTPTCAWYATGFVTDPSPPVFLVIPKVIRSNCINCCEEWP